MTRQGRGSAWDLSATAGAALGSIVAADYLAPGRLGIGTSLLLLVLLALVLTRWHGRVGRPGHLRAAAAPLCIVIASCLALTWDPGWLALTLALLALMTLAAGAASGWSLDVIPAALRLVITPFLAAARPLRDMSVRAKWWSARHRRHDRPAMPSPMSFARQWRLPAITAGVFFVIFCIANPILAHATSSAWREIVTMRIPPLSRLTFWLIAGVGAWWLVRARLPPWMRSLGTGVDPGRFVVHTRAAATLRLLIACNVAFLLQSVVDAWYLWSDASLPEGITFAEYAQHGAWLLMFAVLLSATMTLALFGPLAEPMDDVACRALVLAWLAQNAFLVVAAARRLQMYVEEYGLSRLRLAAVAWMLLVLVGIALTAWKVRGRKSHDWQLRANALAAVALLVACSFVPGRSVIAWWNVRHCQESGGKRPLDVSYLSRLGIDALPAILSLPLDRAADERMTRAFRWTRYSLLEQARREREIDTWQSWSMRRAVLQAQAERVTPQGGVPVW